MPSGRFVLWSMWVDALQWDSGNAVAIHYKLSKEHIHLTNASKMRNHLAEEVLNKDMLRLMTAYAEHLGSKGIICCSTVDICLMVMNFI